ncbi:MAG TPA: hypothetical protein VGF85_03045 [Opitutaceae bacterium]|jgi:hypothetical protein
MGAGLRYGLRSLARAPGFTAGLGSDTHLQGRFAALLVGHYGRPAFQVARRTGEIGIRTALGAQVRDITLLVYRSGMHLVFGGLSAGLIPSALGWRPLHGSSAVAALARF